MYSETLLPGKGCGVVAVRDISPGELIIAETPLLLLPWWVRHSFFPGREKKIYLERCVKDFNSDQRKQFFQLHDSKVGENEEKTIDGIWRTNNFALGPSSPKCDNGLFLRISRFNHSCVPYAEFVWNEDRKVQEIRAVRHIPRGAEITISYFTKLLAVKSQRERRTAMLEQYGFECDCQACTLTGEERKENNQQRRLVDDLDLLIERLLYDFPPEEENIQVSSASPKVEVDISLAWLDKLESATEETESRDILTAIKLNYYKLHLMEKLGFKVVSQISVCSYILEICKEWQLEEAGYPALESGVKLAECIYGQKSKHYKAWLEKRKNFNRI